jgi:hypothetical protein
MLSMLKRNASVAALVVAVVALFVAIGGVAGALPGKNTVNSGDVKRNSLKGVDIKESTLNIPQKALPESVQNVYGFTWIGNELSRQTLSGVTAQRNGNSITYTFPFDVTQCAPVASGIFSDGIVALQAGTAPNNRNKVIVSGFDATQDHNLVVVCP